jgi:hypothetical protein
MVSSKARRGSVFFAGAMLAVAASTVACAAVLGFERLSEDSAPEASSPEASSPDGAGQPDAAADPCAQLGLPAPPTAPAAGNGADATAGPGPLYMALSLIDLGMDASAPPAGLNLDQVCSTTVATSSCKTAVDPQRWQSLCMDKNDSGLDNAGLGILTILGDLGPAFSPKEINARLQAGGYGLVLQVSNYNGASEDSDVNVALYPALGVLQQGDAGLNADGGLTFAPSDEWMLDRSFQFGLARDVSTIKSVGAYVTRGRLVAPFPVMTLPVSVPADPKPFRIVLNEAYLSADLSSAGGRWALSQGVLAGRWKTSDFLAQLRTVYIESSGVVSKTYLCDPNGRIAYDLVRETICAARDIRGASSQDNAAMSCDAFSSAVRFETYPLDTLGKFVDSPDAGQRCSPVAGGAPEGDDCAPAPP